MPHLGAFGAAWIASTWEPGHLQWEVQGYQAAINKSLSVCASTGLVSLLRRSERSLSEKSDNESRKALLLRTSDSDYFGLPPGVTATLPRNPKDIQPRRFRSGSLILACEAQ